MPLHASPESSLAPTCIVATPEDGHVKLEKGARVEDFVYLGGRIHLQDNSAIQNFCRLEGTITLASDAKVSTHCTISGRVSIGPRAKVLAACILLGPLEVARDVQIGNGVKVLSDYKTAGQERDVTTIGPGATIGDGAVICAGSKIGPGSTVEPGAYFSGNLPADCVFTREGKVESQYTVCPSTTMLEVQSPDQLQTQLIKSMSKICSAEGMAQYTLRLDDDLLLDFFLHNKNSRTLVVSLHGAVDRNKGKPPRYEWWKTLKNTRYSTLFLSDPSLHTNPSLRLGWFLGNEKVNLFEKIAELAEQARRSIGAEKIILTGLSGGGFAALQISKLLPNSTALVFNPRTEIPVNQNDGSIWWTFYFYLKCVAPSLTPPKAQSKYLQEFQTSDLSRRISARRSYSNPSTNQVIFYTNVDEQYHASECIPFKDSLATENNVSFVEYNAGEAHQPPTRNMFLKALRAADQKI